jgi:predicted RNA-binding protein YlxR (DUF448 family)
MSAEAVDPTPPTAAPPALVGGGSTGMGASQPSKHKKRKGLKPRHIPQRTCIVTRQTGDKRGLVRIVRTPAGRVEVDLTGKKNGRGAYVTADRAIWERALAGNILARALKVEIVPEDLATLRAYGESLSQED